MKQVNPKSGVKKVGINLEDKIDEFNEAQVLQLYELFQETKKPILPKKI
jgi:hypothetical protein